MNGPKPWSPLRLLPAADSESGRAWLVTFTDLICLLLTFFVMLYAMSEPDPARYRELVSALPGISEQGGGEQQPGAAMTALPLERGRAVDLGYLGRVYENLLLDNPELSQVTITRGDEGLVLGLPADLLFAPGDATLSDAGRQAMFVMGGVAANIGNAVDVVGHADPTPSGSRWPSNWELSLARAQAVAAALREAGYLRAVTVRGHGAGQVPTGEAGPDAYARARRVELVVREHGAGR